VQAASRQLHQVPRIYEGMAHLLENDKIFKKWGKTPKDFDRAFYGTGFAGLCRIVIGQQVSTQAADSLWARFQNGLPNITPNAALVLTPDEMRELGLSHQKAKYILGLATAMNGGDFDPVALERMGDDEVLEAVTALNGFGAWSAQIYLMFCLARPDVFPADDLGIQEGLRLYLNLKERPTAAQVREYGQVFAPHRTAASILLWHLKANPQL